MNLFDLKIPAGYKNVSNCLLKITLCRGAFLWDFWGGLGAVAPLPPY